MKLTDVKFPLRYSPFSDGFGEELAKKLPSEKELCPAVIKSIHTTLKIAAFYRYARAKKYYISCSNHVGYKHPHMELICGIIIAAVSQGHKCTIVLKSSDAELYEKLKLFAFVLHGYDWKKSVTIKYLTVEPLI